MAFVNALAGLLPPQGYVPGFAGGMIGGYGQGDNQQWAGPFSISGPAQNIDPAQLAQLAQGAVQPKRQGGGGLRNILGMLGDSIMAAHGGERLYEKRHQEQQLNGALQNFLTDPDGAIAQVMQFDAPTAISLYKMVHPSPGAPPAIVAEMQAAGIDPRSPEGQAIIKGHLNTGDNPSTFERELNALGIDPRSPEARELYYGRNSPAGYLLRPPGGGGAPTGPQPGQVVGGYRFRGGNPNDKNSWEPAGGASPGGSQTFP